MSFEDLEAGMHEKVRVNGDRNPTQAVLSGMFQINTHVNTFEKLISTLGTPKDTPSQRDKLHKTRLYILQLVNDTSDKLKQISEEDHTSEVSTHRKIADAKLAQQFQETLRRFQKAQHLSALRETSYAPLVPQTLLSLSHTESEVEANFDKTHEQRVMLVESRRQEMLLDNDIIFNEAIIEEREQGIQEVQQQIGEVHEIFKDLALLVHDQGAMIDDIDSNIESSLAATSQGRTQLEKAAKTQKSNSSMKCLLLVIVGVVLLIVTIVFSA